MLKSDSRVHRSKVQKKERFSNITFNGMDAARWAITFNGSDAARLAITFNGKDAARLVITFNITDTCMVPELLFQPIYIQ